VLDPIATYFLETVIQVYYKNQDHILYFTHLGSTIAWWLLKPQHISQDNNIYYSQTSHNQPPKMQRFLWEVVAKLTRKGLIQGKFLTYCVSTFWKIIFYIQFEVLCILCSSVVLKQWTKRPHHASSGHSQEVKNNENYKNVRLESGDNRLSEVVVCERFLLSCDWENQFGVFWKVVANESWSIMKFHLYYILF